MNLTRLQTFAEVVRRGTFAGAADALSFTPSAVSQQMAKLEAEAGAVLLEREPGGVRLTEAGRVLHAHALAIADAVRGARADLDALRADQVKRLRLGACPVAAAALLPRAVRLLRRRLPAADLVLEEREDAAAALAAGELDAAVWVAGSEPEAPGLVETVLARGPLCAALADDHPLARLPQLDAEALAATPRLGGPRSRVATLSALLALAAAGEGYALVPGAVAAALPPGVALRPMAGAPGWELRAGRPAGEVLSVGTLAALEAFKRASSGAPGHVESSGSGVVAQ